ncbi:MAG: hypothetical protein M1824_000290, partial [Vezdaea acicularis]
MATKVRGMQPDREKRDSMSHGPPADQRNGLRVTNPGPRRTSVGTYPPVLFIASTGNSLQGTIYDKGKKGEYHEVFNFVRKTK